ncbi:MAG: hypothetical protein Gaeavirus13_4 [Gaeavirus sp.]|uniref:Uncharacterized protein n=1 Tax=Gaeavirus sp. TaxID=2487767 RepID=A0A3G4ZZ56_9VIRU|nr:MAG: hypothetical protein Gaeavirus13_4 [Gaeavirus sp.]
MNNNIFLNIFHFTSKPSFTGLNSIFCDNFP